MIGNCEAKLDGDLGRCEICDFPTHHWYAQVKGFVCPHCAKIYRVSDVLSVMVDDEGVA